jgi:hypothetical protein
VAPFFYFRAAEAAVPRSVENFSLLGGPLHQLGARLGLVRGANTVAMGLALGWLPWLVLIALALAQGGSQQLFSLSAVAVHARLLLAVPLFFVAETMLDAKLREFMALLVRSEVAGAKALLELEREAARLSRREESWLPDTASLLAAAALSYFGAAAGLPAEVEPGRALGGTPIAGSWYVLFCLPLIRFLIFRWVWRLVTWWALLWRLTRVDLDLSPAHPDGVAGLGYLEIVHTRFTTLAMAISIIVAATFAEDIALGETTLSEVYPALAATLLVDCLLFLAPPCVFAFKLRDCQEKGLRDYSVLSARYTHAFERKWITGAPPQEPLLGTPDLQSLADLSNSVSNVRKMRLAPVGLRLVVSIGAAAIAPMLPLLLFDYPFAELAKMLFSKLAGL